MAIDSHHPAYVKKAALWEKIEHVYEGEERIKEEGDKYLPPMSGMILDGMAKGQQGRKNYENYKDRAIFRGYFKDAVDTLTGIMHNKPPHIELPDEMQPLRKWASADGESLDLVMRRITQYQLTYGRTGLLLEVPSGRSPAETVPYFAIYTAPRIINWNAGMREQGDIFTRLVVLDESAWEMDPMSFEWQYINKYRVLRLHPETDQYQVAVKRTTEESALVEEEDWITPHIAGQTLSRIPFQFINAKDLSPDPDVPPMLQLANLDLAIYRNEADYQYNLHWQSQETLVIIGGTDPFGGSEQEQKRVGAGAFLEIPLEGDAKYIGVSADGLSEQRQALESDRDSATQQGSRMLSTKGGDQQSGDALRTRVAAQTASLPNIARAGAEAMNDLLTMAAQWMLIDSSKVLVEPNLDFTAEEMGGREVFDLMQAKAMGAPLSNQSLHRLFKRKNLTESNFEEELADINSEGPMLPTAESLRGVQGVGGNADGE